MWLPLWKMLPSFSSIWILLCIEGGKTTNIYSWTTTSQAEDKMANLLTFRKKRSASQWPPVHNAQWYRGRSGSVLSRSQISDQCPFLWCLPSQNMVSFPHCLNWPNCFVCLCLCLLNSHFIAYLLWFNTQWNLLTEVPEMTKSSTQGGKEQCRNGCYGNVYSSIGVMKP